MAPAISLTRVFQRAICYPRRRVLFCPVLFLIIFAILFRHLYPHHDNRPTWRSKSLEAEFLRVMKYIENGRNLSPKIRKEFQNRLWRRLQINQGLYWLEGESNQVLDNVSYSLNDEKDLMRSNVLDIDSSSKNRIFQKIPLEEFLAKPVLNPFKISYHNSQSTACLQRPIDVIIAVPSAPNNFKRRQTIRHSNRAIFAQNPTNRAKLLFFLGRPDPALEESTQIQNAVDQEQAKFGDIVQATFFDTYRNITQKAALLLDWSSKYCSKAEFLIRTDDDVRVNITNMIAAMANTSNNLDHFILGQAKVNEIIKRKRSSKYFVPFEDNPYDVLPPFVLGGAMGYPIKTAHLLLEAMRRVVFFWLDDVFVSGLCAPRVGVPVFDSDAFTFEH